MADITVDAFGFDWGKVRVARISDRDGHIFIGLTTPREDLLLHVTPSGYVRITDNAKARQEIKP